MIFIEVNDRMKYFGESCDSLIIAYNQDSIKRL